MLKVVRSKGALQVRSSFESTLRRLGAATALAFVLSGGFAQQSVALPPGNPVAPPQGKLVVPVVPPSLRAFSARVEKVKKNVPEIVRVATVAADHILAHPGALIDVPYGEQPSFAEEVLNRAGGLSNPLPNVERAGLVTPNDISLLSVRAWDEDGAKMIPLMQSARKRGWKIFLFASRAGMPKDVIYDHLIDNGATSGGKDEAATNALTNILNSWLWTCEYTAALTRGGKYPGVLSSILAAGADEHNKKIQTPEGRPFLGVSEKPIAAGALAAVYLRRVDVLLKDLGGEKVQSEIARTADIIVRYLKAGKTVGTATVTHFLMSEIFENRKTPMKPFNSVWHSKTAFKENLKPGDLVVWIGYVGVSTLYEDYLTAIRDAKVDLVASFVLDKNVPNNAPEALSVIAQNWSIPDAEVPVHFAPGRIAPVSGLDQGLIYRMLEDAVAARLPKNLPQQKPVDAKP